MKTHVEVAALVAAALVALRIRFRPGTPSKFQHVTREYLPVSPITLPCPLCGAKPGHDCETPSNVRLYIVHVARIKAAATMDLARKA